MGLAFRCATECVSPSRFLPQLDRYEYICLSALDRGYVSSYIPLIGSDTVSVVRQEEEMHFPLVSALRKQYQMGENGCKQMGSICKYNSGNKDFSFF